MKVGMGVHPFGDPSITDDFAQVALALDALEPHVYAAEWTPDHVAFYVDETLVRVVSQSPAYPMQLMLNIYELPDDDGTRSPVEAYPKVFEVTRFRGWRPRTGPGSRLPAFP